MRPRSAAASCFGSYHPSANPESRRLLRSGDAPSMRSSSRATKRLSRRRHTSAIFTAPPLDAFLTTTDIVTTTDDVVA